MGGGGSAVATVGNLLAALPARSRGPGSLEALQRLLEKYTHVAPQVREKIGKRIERGWIGDRLKAAHHYRCQICAALDCDERTFSKRDGNAYVEVHHVDPVSQARPARSGRRMCLSYVPHTIANSITGRRLASSITETGLRLSWRSARQ